MGRPAEHGVVRLFSVLACRAGFLISADEEYRVVRAGGDRQCHQQVGGEGRETDDLVVAEECHHTAGRGQLQHDHDEGQQHGDDRPVDEQQHHDDHRERDGLDHLHASVAGDVLVRCQRGGTGDERLHARRRLHAVDDALDGLDRLVGQRLALVACQVHLDVGGLAVVALRARGGQRVAPEVLNALDVLLVGLELARSSGRRRLWCRRRAAARPRARSSPSCRS